MPYLGRVPAAVPVNASDIPDNSITAAKIVDGAIAVADIADDAVTEAKLANAINTAISDNTAKTGITSGQASAITANTAKVTNATHTGDVTGATALTIADNAVTLAKMAGGTDGELITYDTLGDPAKVAVGTSGHVLTSGGVGVAPTFQAVAAGTHDFTADGALAANGTTTILQADGTVKAVALATTSISEDLTFSEVSSITNVSDDLFFALDPFNENKILLIYRDTDMWVVCGTIASDGNSVSWGTRVLINANYGDAGSSSIDFDPSTENSFIIVLKGRDTSNQHHAYATAGTISGTTVTLGTELDISFCTSSDYLNATKGYFNPSQAGQVIAVSSNYDGASCAGGLAQQLEIKVLTVSGTTVTHVSSAIVSTASSLKPDLSWDKVTANKGYIWASLTSYYPNVIPFTMSGNTVTLGTTQVINSTTSTGYHMGATLAEEGRLVSIYKDSGNISVAVGNDSSTGAGGTITWGTSVEVANYVSEGNNLLLYPTICTDENTPSKLFMGYNIPVSGSSSRWRVGTVSGTNTVTLAAGYTHILTSSATPDINKNIKADPFNPGLFYTAHSHTGDSTKAKIVGSQVASSSNVTNLTATNFIGTATAAVADTATATIKLKGGVSSGHSSLTIGSDYYIQTNGTLGTSAATPSVKIGKAISATQILMKGET
jgi:hypothetical protein